MVLWPWPNISVRNPRDIAQKIVGAVELDGIASQLEIAGPGFINIHLDETWVADLVAVASRDPRLGIAQEPAQTVVVDYCHQNLAKEMHVGHLRTTIIGDAVVKALEFMDTRLSVRTTWEIGVRNLVCYWLTCQIS